MTLHVGLCVLPRIGGVEVGGPARLPGVLLPSVSAKARWPSEASMRMSPRAQRGLQQALRAVRKIPPGCGRGVLVVNPHGKRLLRRRVVGEWERGRLHGVRRRVKRQVG